MTATFLGPIGEAYDSQIIDSGRQAEFLLLVAFLLSFLFIRASTRLMRSPRVPWWPGSVTPGGLHIHHLVFGIVMMLIAGFLQFALQPGSPGVEIFAVVFGIGAGLTIDEFALWLHLEDVYWTKEGRVSIDAFVVSLLVAGLVFLGIAPFEDFDPSDVLWSIVSIVFVLAMIAICLAKGKVVFALVGLFIQPVALVGAIRLGRPKSPWARKRYPEGSRKLEKAQARERKWDARRLRWRDLIGGAPHLERPERDSVG